MSENLMTGYVTVITKESWWKNHLASLDGRNLYSIGCFSPSILRLSSLVGSLGIVCSKLIDVSMFTMTLLNERLF